MPMSERTVCVVTGSRAEYGLLRPVMTEIRSRMRLQVVVTGMHLLPALGDTQHDIVDDGFPIDARVPSLLAGDDAPAAAKSIGIGVMGMTDAYQALRPDIVLVLGDRTEILSAAIAAAFSGLVLGHIHGGDSPRGGYDEYARHAITKMAHLHFPATEASAERIRRMGEDPVNVHVVGAPGLDSILNEPLPGPDELRGRYGLGPGPFLLFVLHPVSTDPDGAADEMRTALEATVEAGLPVVALYPNADPGGEVMRLSLEREAGRLIARPSIPHRDYLGLVRDASALVGNSSSGIIEAPAVGTPAVNIGPRQEGRERGANVIDVPVDRGRIREAIERAVNDSAFRESISTAPNPYGDGQAARRIVDVLETVDIGPAIRRKRLTY